jgi:Sulfotransferase family
MVSLASGRWSMSLRSWAFWMPRPPPPNELHDEERLAFIGIDIMNGANVGMIQGRSRAGLALEALQGPDVLGILHERLMCHWKKVLPIRIFDVCYEALVDDPEQISRDIVAFCGLPWDDACLRFHETQRIVRTSSNLQVRQPVYKSSVGYWKNYEPHLGPLLDALHQP